MLVHVSMHELCLLGFACADFMSDFDVGACIFKENMTIKRHSTYHLKAHRIRNNMVLKQPAQR